MYNSISPVFVSVSSCVFLYSLFDFSFVVIFTYVVILRTLTNTYCRLFFSKWNCFFKIFQRRFSSVALLSELIENAADDYFVRWTVNYFISHFIPMRWMFSQTINILLVLESPKHMPFFRAPFLFFSVTFIGATATFVIHT